MEDTQSGEEDWEEEEVNRPIGHRVITRWQELERKGMTESQTLGIIP